VEVLQEKINYLIKIVGRLTLRTKNLNVILRSQNYIFKKFSLANVRKNLKTFLTTVKGKTSPFVTCFDYIRKGHSVRTYNVRKFDISKGLVKWVLKGTQLIVLNPSLIGDHC